MIVTETISLSNNISNLYSESIIVFGNRDSVILISEVNDRAGILQSL